MTSISTFKLVACMTFVSCIGISVSQAHENPGDFGGDFSDTTQYFKPGTDQLVNNDRRIVNDIDDVEQNLIKILRRLTTKYVPPQMEEADSKADNHKSEADNLIVEEQTYTTQSEDAQESENVQQPQYSPWNPRGWSRTKRVAVGLVVVVLGIPCVIYNALNSQEAS